MSDVPVPGVKTIPLKYNWPDWWCKMEVFRPELRGDFLLTDLDNLFVGPLDDVLNTGTYTTQKGESNALAYMTEDVRAAVWEEWIKDPEGHMHYWHPNNTPIKHQFGDAGYIHSLLCATKHWEEALPGQVVNIASMGIAKSGMPIWSRLMHTALLPPNTRVLLCWRPWRPWNVPMLRRFGMYYEERK